MEPQKAGHASRSPCQLSSELTASVEGEHGKEGAVRPELSSEADRPCLTPLLLPLPHRLQKNPRSC